MSGFLYFKPGVSAVTKESVKEWGLGYAFYDRVVGTKCQSNTPSGAAGLVFADKTRLGDRDIRMDLANQEWGKIPKSDVWVGFWKGSRPDPELLKRPQQLPGWVVLLADGLEWSIPKVRKFDVGSAELVSALPCYMTCDDNGNWIPGQVMDIHAHLWELVTPFADELMAAKANEDYQAKDFSDAQIYDTVTTLLQTNYVVGPGELSVMRAFARESGTHGAILAACDFPTFWAWNDDQKKSNLASIPDTQNSTDGVAA